MEITLYSQPGCPQCRMIHMLLNKKGIKYKECQDVELMKKKGINHTPVLEVGGELLVGKAIFDYVNSRK